jgi:hypothetical protein
MAKSPRKATKKELDAIKKLDESAILAQERITIAAEKAQKMIDDACAVATDALTVSANRPAERVGNGGYRWDSRDRSTADRLDRLEEQIDMINMAKNLLEIGQATREEQITGLRNQLHQIDQDIVENKEQVAATNKKFEDALAVTNEKFEEVIESRNAANASALAATNEKFEDALLITNKKFDDALLATNKKFDDALLATNTKFDNLNVHDELIELRVKLDYVTERQLGVVERLAGIDARQEDIGGTLETLKLSTATEKSESRSFVAGHINTILGLLVVGLVTTVLMIIFYTIH